MGGQDVLFIFRTQATHSVFRRMAYYILDKVKDIILVYSQGLLPDTLDKREYYYAGSQFRQCCEFFLAQLHHCKQKIYVGEISCIS